MLTGWPLFVCFCWGGCLGCFLSSYGGLLLLVRLGKRCRGGSCEAVRIR